ncbi:Ig-like domain-containing protein [Corynebacterium diphtheriae]
MFFNGDEEIGRAKTANDVAELQTTVPDEAATLQLSAVKPALVGEKWTLSARYEVSAGFPEGAKVIFCANGVRVGTAQTDAEGNASVEHVFDQAGLQKITAEVREREVDGRLFSKAEAEAEPFGF